MRAGRESMVVVLIKARGRIGVEWINVQHSRSQARSVRRDARGC